MLESDKDAERELPQLRVQSVAAWALHRLGCIMEAAGVFFTDTEAAAFVENHSGNEAFFWFEDPPICIRLCRKHYSSKRAQKHSRTGRLFVATYISLAATSIHNHTPRYPSCHFHCFLFHKITAYCKDQTDLAK